MEQYHRSDRRQLPTRCQGDGVRQTNTGASVSGARDAAGCSAAYGVDWWHAVRTVQIDSFLACTQLVEVYYRWRPNLPDEADNHVLELAVAAGRATILTFNRRDFSRGELRFPDVAIRSPADWLKEE